MYGARSTRESEKGHFSRGGKSRRREATRKKDETRRNFLESNFRLSKLRVATEKQHLTIHEEGLLTSVISFSEICRRFDCKRKLFVTILARETESLNTSTTSLIINLNTFSDSLDYVAE